jgi:hypothetical protein
MQDLSLAEVRARRSIAALDAFLVVKHMSILTREKLRSVLVDWQAGALQPLEVLEWAEESVELESQSDEVIKEILSRLDILHLNLVTVEDVPVFLQVLDTPTERWREALNLLENHENNIDWEARKERYQDHPFYGPML